MGYIQVMFGLAFYWKESEKMFGKNSFSKLKNYFRKNWSYHWKIFSFYEKQLQISLSTLTKNTIFLYYKSK